MYKLRLVKRTDRESVSFYIQKENVEGRWVPYKDVSSFEEGKRIMDQKKEEDEIRKNVKEEVVYGPLE